MKAGALSRTRVVLALSLLLQRQDLGRRIAGSRRQWCDVRHEINGNALLANAEDDPTRNYVAGYLLRFLRVRCLGAIERYDFVVGPARPW